MSHEVNVELAQIKAQLNAIRAQVSTIASRETHRICQQVKAQLAEVEVTQKNLSGEVAHLNESLNEFNQRASAIDDLGRRILEKMPDVRITEMADKFAKHLDDAERLADELRKMLKNLQVAGDANSVESLSSIVRLLIDFFSSHAARQQRPATKTVGTAVGAGD